MSELDEYLQEEALAKMRSNAAEAEKKRIFESFVAHAPEGEFQAWKNRIISEGDAAKARGDIAPLEENPGVVKATTREERELEAGLNTLDDFEYAEELRSIGVSTRLDAPLSQHVAHGTERAEQAAFDERADKYVARRGGGI